MWNKSFCAAIAFLFYGATAVQAAGVGKAVQVNGLVTVSDGATITSVSNDNAVFEGSRYVTSSTGSLTLKLESGCELKLKPNQSVVIRAESCDKLLASVQTLPDPGALLAGATGSPAAPGNFLEMMSSPVVPNMMVSGIAIVDMRWRDKGNALVTNPPISGQ